LLHYGSYGYNWWIANNSPTPIYYAGGRGGQFICFAEDISFVTAITSYWDIHYEQNRFIIDNYIYPAIKNSGQTIINEEIKLQRENYLFQNYPNPFNPATTIAYRLKDDGMVSLKVYDILGREVTDLVNDYQTAGEYRAIFNSASSISNPGLTSSIYFYKLNVNGFSEVKRMILLK
jgi:Secretion system C-terminal sorting domain